VGVATGAAEGKEKKKAAVAAAAAAAVAKAAKATEANGGKAAAAVAATEAKKASGAAPTASAAAALKLSPNQLRFVCFGGYALVLLAMYGISPFFQSDAQRRVGMAPSLAGLVFAEAALTSMLATPVSAQLCKAVGRYPTLYLGYAVSISANIGFGLADSVAAMVAFRALQGVAMGAFSFPSLSEAGVHGSDSGPSTHNTDCPSPRHHTIIRAGGRRLHDAAHIRVP